MQVYGKPSPKTVVAEFLSAPLKTPVLPNQGTIDEYRSDTDTPCGRARLLAKAVLQQSPLPQPNNSVHQYLGSIRNTLRAAGLPYRAKGVRVFVTNASMGVGDDEKPILTAVNPHERLVAELIAGKVGLAQGCDLRILTATQVEATVPNSTRARRAKMESLIDDLIFGDGTLEDAATVVAQQMTESLEDRRLEVALIEKQVPDDGGFTVVNASWGASLVRWANFCAKMMLNSAPESTTFESAMGATGGTKGLAALAACIAGRAEQLMQSDAVPGKRYRAERAKLAAQIRAARDKGILYFTSAGNDYEIATTQMGQESFSRGASAGVPGIVSVASIDLQDVTDPNDDTVAADSASGDLAFVGCNVAFGNEVQSGTSFASPLAAATAALMSCANPALTPDDIERILRSEGVATRTGFDQRVGDGAVDIVRAVSEAARTAIS